MSLAIGIISKEGFVLAADSRMSSPFFSNDSADKIIGLSDHVAAVIAGDGALALHVFDIIKKDSLLKLDEGIQSVADQIHLLFSKSFDKYYPTVKNEKRERLEILLAGYSAGENKVPHLYVLDSTDNFVPRQSPSGQNSIGTSHISEYILNRIYDKGKMASDQAVKLSVFCIQETMNQTRNVGGKIKVGTFSEKVKFSLMPKATVSKVFDTCKKLQDRHRNKFYPEELGDSESSENEIPNNK
jgi:20S proteasome alpha/beta subunit